MILCALRVFFIINIDSWGCNGKNKIMLIFFKGGDAFYFKTKISYMIVRSVSVLDVGDGAEIWGVLLISL